MEYRMGLLETQNFLARLLTDPVLRAAFLAEPETLGLEGGLTGEEIENLRQVLPEELNSFSESLFYKRLREVEKLLPLARRGLGRDFDALFRRFAAGSQPETIKKHLEDAVNFVDFLSGQAFEFPWAIDLARYEQARLKFGGFDKKFIFCKFDYDILFISRELPRRKANHQENDFPRRKTFAVWFRIRGESRQFIW